MVVELVNYNTNGVKLNHQFWDTVHGIPNIRHCFACFSSTVDAAGDEYGDEGDSD